MLLCLAAKQPKGSQGEPINVERQLCCLSIRTAVLNPAYKYVTGIFVKRRDRKRARYRYQVFHPKLFRMSQT